MIAAQSVSDTEPIQPKLTEAPHWIQLKLTETFQLKLTEAPLGITAQSAYAFWVQG